MEKLQDLSQSELEDLLDNSERVESMALESDEIQNIQLEREMALASNRSLAEQNLDMKPKLEGERERLVEKYSELEAVREQYKHHCALRDSIMGQVSPEGLLSRLQVEGANTEEESEALADEFLEGSLPLDSFLERFLSLRSLAHRRRVRIEKLQEILRQKSESGGDGVTSQSGAGQPDPGSAAAPSPWQHQGQQPAASGNPSSTASFPNACPNPPNSALPYPPYPAVPPSQPDARVAATGPPSNPSNQYQPYPSQGSPFISSSGYPGNSAAFGPSACPYPSQPTFPRPPFGQFGPSPAPYPYSYSYPGGPSIPPSHSPTGRPLYRPGFGVPQPYS